MMRWLIGIPIRGKLMLLGGSVAALALVISGVVLVYFAYVGTKSELQHRLQTHANIMAISSAAALAFDDAEAAQTTVQALAGERAILAAEIRRADNSVFITHTFVQRPLEEIRNGDDVVHVIADVNLQRRIGTGHVWASDAADHDRPGDARAGPRGGGVLHCGALRGLTSAAHDLRAHPRAREHGVCCFEVAQLRTAGGGAEQRRSGRADH